MNIISQVFLRVSLLLCILCAHWALQVAQWIKNPPAVQETQETWVRSLGQEDPLDDGMAIHLSILAWRILWTEESGELQSMGSQRVRLN